MNSTQIKTLLAPLVGIIAAWLARKVPFIDAATWSTWIDTTISAAVLAFIGYVTGKPQLADSLAAYTDTKVITDAKTAAATKSDDVVSSAEVKVLPK